MEFRLCSLTTVIQVLRPERYFDLAVFLPPDAILRVRPPAVVGGCGSLSRGKVFDGFLALGMWRLLDRLSGACEVNAGATSEFQGLPSLSISAAASASGWRCRARGLRAARPSRSGAPGSWRWGCASESEPRSALAGRSKALRGRFERAG